MTQTSPQPEPNNATNGQRTPATENALETSPEGQKPTVPDAETSNQGFRQLKLGLRAKATALAITLGTLPVLGIGATAYYFADQSIIRQVTQEKQASATGIGNLVSRFMSERYGDIQVVAKLPLFRNRQVAAAISLQEKQEVLDSLIKIYGVYDSVAVFDLNGNAIAQSQGQPLSNHKNQTYFQEVLKTDRPVIGDPEKSKSTGELVIHFAAPVKDAATGKTIAVARSRMPMKFLENTIKSYGVGGDEYHLVDNTEKFFLALEKEQVGRSAAEDFSGFEKADEARKLSTWVTVDQIDNNEQLVTFAPLEKLEGMPELEWDVILATDTAAAFAPQRQLLITILLGTVLTAVLVSAIAAYLANRVVHPIEEAADAVEKLGQGELDTRIEVAGQDELAMLGSNVNQLASQLQTLVHNQELQIEHSRFLANIAFMGVRDDQGLQSAFDRAVKGARKILNVERMVIYRFQPDGSGYIAAEAVVPGLPSVLGEKINDPCISSELLESYKKGRVAAHNNVKQAGFHPEHQKLMERLQIQANLIAPILQNQQLVGLLIAHHCNSPHDWQPTEVNFLRQLATQLGFILDRVTFLEQQKADKEQLQKRALELLMEVDPVNKGDLTIRANVTEDEIGTIADSYNATISNLRRIVAQVQSAAQKMATTTQSSEGVVSELSTEALRQTAEITAALERIQEMSNSIRDVATSAALAEAAVQQATQTVTAGDLAMNRTVDGILAIQETVTETAKQVKQLGESSQKISKVVNLIGRFAAQTNLLALKASIEAARAGEEGRGFAVLADEVRVLASQSAQATADIESLVAAIQTETNAVVAAMEAGTQKVAQGSQLVNETRDSLSQITSVSTQISELVKAIAEATVAQSQASADVTQTMSGVAAISSKNSTEATLVSDSFKELLAVAHELQASAAQFKVS